MDPIVRDRLFRANCISFLGQPEGHSGITVITFKKNVIIVIVSRVSASWKPGKQLFIKGEFRSDRLWKFYSREIEEKQYRGNGIRRKKKNIEQRESLTSFSWKLIIPTRRVEGHGRYRNYLYSARFRAILSSRWRFLTLLIAIASLWQFDAARSLQVKQPTCVASLYAWYRWASTLQLLKAGSRKALVYPARRNSLPWSESIKLDS